MPYYKLDDRLLFPDPAEADNEGLLAFGGDASPERLLVAYSQGIFPWPHTGYPLLWFSPDPRFVLIPEKIHISKSLKKTIKKQIFEIRVDTAFEKVMQACKTQKRPGQGGTWITKELIRGFTSLHNTGFAHSIEAWQKNRLVGGLYGISLGGAFFGESMFAYESDASKVAFVSLAGNLKNWDFDFIDCQVFTQYLASFGAEFWPRTTYLANLEETITNKPTNIRKWVFELNSMNALEILESSKEIYL